MDVSDFSVSKSDNDIISIKSNDRLQKTGNDNISQEGNFNDLHVKWMVACCKCSKEAIEEILESNPKMIDIKDPLLTYTAIHWAARYGDDELIQFLLEKNANVNIQTWEGHTPLHLANIFNKRQTIKLLSALKICDQKICDFYGNRPEFYENHRVQKETYKKIMDANETVNAMKIGSSSMEKNSIRDQKKGKLDNTRSITDNRLFTIDENKTHSSIRKMSISRRNTKSSKSLFND